MSDFVQFARAHGILIDSLPPIGRWVRLPTQDKPRSRNGAVKFMGDHGFCQNHATQTDVSVWKPDAESAIKIDHKAVAEAAQRVELQRQEDRRKAAAKAAWIIGQTQQTMHPYLERKGFPDERGMVWTRDGAKILVVPMRIGRDVCGCQLISEAGEKKFLSGQATAGAAFVIGYGDPVFCEGYATALSVRAALAAAKVRRAIVATFSAGNMARLAKGAQNAVCVADNDASGTGERVARESGAPYWISDQQGEDFNDYMLRVGLFRASQSLRGALMCKRE